MVKVGHGTFIHIFMLLQLLLLIAVSEGSILKRPKRHWQGKVQLVTVYDARTSDFERCVNNCYWRVELHQICTWGDAARGARPSERSSPKREELAQARDSVLFPDIFLGFSPEREGAHLSEREVLRLDESRLGETTSPEREHQILSDAKSRGFSPKRAYSRLSESPKS
ncbi:hypothetical protein Lal_00003868 [Lupinus albus]|nr:hypothetical protein Lal_00003868 [Lupinus albus]